MFHDILFLFSAAHYLLILYLTKSLLRSPEIELPISISRNSQTIALIEVGLFLFMISWDKSVSKTYTIEPNITASLFLYTALVGILYFFLS